MKEEPQEVLRVLRTRGETRAFYNKISRVYDILAERSEEPIRRVAMEKLDAQPGENVLEIGFATGQSLAQLARAVGPSGKVYGVELAEEMLRIALARMRGEGLSERVQLTAGDAISLPYADHCMDAAFMSFTLELFDTPEIPAVLGECRRVLRPGGRIAVAGISKCGGNNAMVHAFEWTHRHFPNLMDCRPIFVQRALESAGFGILSAEIQAMWVPVEIVLAGK